VPGIDLLAPLQTGTLAKKAYDAVRAKSAKVHTGPPLGGEIEALSALVAEVGFSSLLR